MIKLIHFLTNKSFIAYSVLLLIAINVSGQNSPAGDSVLSSAEIVTVDTASYKTHSPHKATIYSLILPGLGQAYNKKYWKIPIIYGGFGVFYYFISFNHKEYIMWRDAYYHALVNDGSEPPVNEYEELYGSRTDILLDQKNYYRRNRDLTYILTGIWYILNVLDATVDAHLFTWEVDEDLTLQWEPAVYEPVYGYKLNGGLKLTLNF
ncbi:MAG: hypothetical protein K8R86_01225 [Bacteroidales bacterium]|nr:hypothetical protein [Bacteroidales bacterium]